MTKKAIKLSGSAYSQLVMAGVLWGFSAFFYKNTLVLVSVALFLAIRFISGALFIFAVGRKKFIKLSLKILMILAVYTIVDTILVNIFYTVGIQKTTALNAAVIHLLTPFLVYFIASILIAEKPHKNVIMGSTVAACGMLFIVFSASNNGNLGSNNIGNIFILLESLFTALAIVVGRKLLLKYKKIPGEQLSFIEYSVAAVPFIFIAFLGGAANELASFAPMTWVWILGASIICGALPLILYNRSVRRLPAERLADISFVSPATSAVVGVSLLGESFTVMFAIGTGLVVTGLLISHKKIHPILIAHKLGSSLETLEKTYAYPKKAYEYIYLESRRLPRFK